MSNMVNAKSSELISSTPSSLNNSTSQNSNNSPNKNYYGNQRNNNNSSISNSNKNSNSSSSSSNSQQRQPQQSQGGNLGANQSATASAKPTGANTKIFTNNTMKNNQYNAAANSQQAPLGNNSQYHNPNYGNYGPNQQSTNQVPTSNQPYQQHHQHQHPHGHHHQMPAAPQVPNYSNILKNQAPNTNSQSNTNSRSNVHQPNRPNASNYHPNKNQQLSQNNANSTSLSYNNNNNNNNANNNSTNSNSTTGGNGNNNQAQTNYQQQAPLMNEPYHANANSNPNQHHHSNANNAHYGHNQQMQQGSHVQAHSSHHHQQTLQQNNYTPNHVKHHNNNYSNNSSNNKQNNDNSNYASKVYNNNPGQKQQQPQQQQAPKQDDHFNANTINQSNPINAKIQPEKEVISSKAPESSESSTTTTTATTTSTPANNTVTNNNNNTNNNRSLSPQGVVVNEEPAVIVSEPAVKQVPVPSEEKPTTTKKEDEPTTIELSTASSSNVEGADSQSAKAEASPVPLATTNNDPKLSDLVQDETTYADRTDYFRNVVLAIDQLYPNVKWPLYNTWTFGYIKNTPTQNWAENIKEIIDVSYVEDFWAVMDRLYTPSMMNAHGDLTFFKKGIRPMWEDNENKNGGSWLHQINNNHQHQFQHGQFKKHLEIDDFWTESLMALVGDNFCGESPFSPGGEGDDDHVCDSIAGIYASHRAKTWKLALWTKNYKDERKTRLIGKMWKYLLKIDEKVTITFEAHETKNSKNANFKIVYKE